MSRSYKIEIWKKNIRYHSNPAEIFYRLCFNKMNTLLLESSENKNNEKRDSKIIIDSALRIIAINNKVILYALSENGKFLLTLLDNIIPNTITVFKKEYERVIYFLKESLYIEEDKRLMLSSVFDCFRWLIQAVQIDSGSLSTLFFGGLFSYDLIYSFEDIVQKNKQSVCPDFCFYLAESMIDINHQKKTAVVQTHLFSSSTTERKRLYTRMQNLYAILQKKNNFLSIPLASKKKLNVTSNMSDVEYGQIINNMRFFIKKGEIFQVVPSRQFYSPCTHPLSVYRILKDTNPSPYMFFMQDTQFTLLGASPESYLKYNADSRIIALHPIAGTRPRGLYKNGEIDLDLDNRIELSLRTDQKELSEHLMLVDLARNDLAKVCLTRSRYVSQLMQVEKYSHVMHLVSRVTGILQPQFDIFHAYQSCMNMGTLTGTPKLRAMQLIAQYESVRRGVYGGSIGYFTGKGSFDACIIIRSAFIKNNIASIQSGAGIVYDSITEDEIQEGKNKAQSVLQSIFHAHQHFKKGDYYV
ncbi:anthranilate synthase component 1 [Buchnera aphidicola]|uniref:Anthranilate synthase component 1 n=1 Tax=Buchnera aphidicola (Cinara curvipes) TaxID=2518975 RepID=A0A451D7T5_9GAMM|nr:anthranilate synthase component 1 [Buchnera aphidicola]VFP81892.1 Anthranilate synthase component 1 [Buchnera aphidicola (Cinara curvipes)]VFP81896.1 Anthranilate synthase component 1 [Buchnera aphidicola (Cinara curvipes)]